MKEKNNSGATILTAFFVTALFSLLMGSVMLFYINSRTGAKTSQPKVPYKVGQQEIKFLRAGARVKFFLDAVRQRDYHKAYQYWYVAKRDDFYNKSDRKKEPVSIKTITPQASAIGDLHLIVDFLSEFNGYFKEGSSDPEEKSIGSSIKKKEILQTLYLLTDKDWLRYRSRDYSTRVKYVAVYGESMFNVYFHVYFKGDVPYIKRVFIKGTKSQVYQLVKNKKYSEYDRGLTYVYPVSGQATTAQEISNKSF